VGLKFSVVLEVVVVVGSVGCCSVCSCVVDLLVQLLVLKKVQCSKKVGVRFNVQKRLV
jgi:hypothetical protein